MINYSNGYSAVKNSSYVCLSDSKNISIYEYVYEPNFIEKIFGITFESKITAAKNRLERLLAKIDNTKVLCDKVLNKQ